MPAPRTRPAVRKAAVKKAVAAKKAAPKKIPDTVKGEDLMMAVINARGCDTGKDAFLKTLGLPPMPDSKHASLTITVVVTGDNVTEKAVKDKLFAEAAKMDGVEYDKSRNNVMVFSRRRRY
jgi:hypothetical protein